MIEKFGNRVKRRLASPSSNVIQAHFAAPVYFVLHSCSCYQKVSLLYTLNTIQQQTLQSTLCSHCNPTFSPVDALARPIVLHAYAFRKVPKIYNGLSRTIDNASKLFVCAGTRALKTLDFRPCLGVMIKQQFDIPDLNYSPALIRYKAIEQRITGLGGIAVVSRRTVDFLA